MEDGPVLSRPDLRWHVQQSAWAQAAAELGVSEAGVPEAVVEGFRRRHAIACLQRFYRSNVAHRTLGELARRFLQSEFDPATMQTMGTQALKAAIDRNKDGGACWDLCLRVLYLTRARPRVNAAAKRSRASLLVSAFLYANQPPMMVTAAGPFAEQQAAMRAGADAFTAALYGWAQAGATRGPLMANVKGSCEGFVREYTRWSRVRAGNQLLTLITNLSTVEKLFSTVGVHLINTAVDVYTRQRGQLLQEIEQIVGKDKCTRAHMTIVRRVQHESQPQAQAGLRLPNLKTLPAEQLAAELLVDPDFTLNDAPVPFPADAAELHQRSPADDAMWDRVKLILDTTAVADAGGTLDRALDATFACIARFEQKREGVEVKAPTKAALLDALKAAAAPRAARLLGEAAAALMAVSLPRRSEQLRREWAALSERYSVDEFADCFVECVRFLYERSQLVYVDSCNAKIRAMAPYIEKHAPKFLLKAYEVRICIRTRPRSGRFSISLASRHCEHWQELLNRGRVSAVQSRPWLIRAKMTAVEQGLVTDDALRGGCRDAMGRVMATAFTQLIASDGGPLPETLAHHARHIAVLRAELEQLALGGAALALLHARCSYDEFYYDVSLAAARVTTIPTRDEMHAMAGTDPAASLPNCTIYTPLGTSWLIPCDFTAFAARANPGPDEILESQREIALAVRAIMIGETPDGGVVFTELAQRIYALAACVQDVARASCAVHWNRYVDVIASCVSPL